MATLPCQISFNVSKLNIQQTNLFGFPQTHHSTGTKFVDCGILIIVHSVYSTTWCAKSARWLYHLKFIDLFRKHSLTGKKLLGGSVVCGSMYECLEENQLTGKNEENYRESVLDFSNSVPTMMSDYITFENRWSASQLLCLCSIFDRPASRHTFHNVLSAIFYWSSSTCEFRQIRFHDFTETTFSTVTEWHFPGSPGDLQVWRLSGMWLSWG